MNLPEKNPAKILTVLFYSALAVLGVFVFFKYLLFPTAPFALGLLLSFALRPAFKLIRFRTKLSCRLCASLLVSICGAFIIFLLYILSVKLYYQAQSFVENFSNGFIGDIIYSVPILPEIMKYAEAVGVDIITAFGDLLAEKMPSLIGSAAELFPKLLFFFTAFVFSAVYFLSDYEEIKEFCRKKLNNSTYFGISSVKKKTLETAYSFLKGYFIIMLLTFGELLLGFFILKVNYALLIAALTAVVDILPVLGVGSVLLPWALFAFAQGNVTRALGLCIMFVVINGVRRFAEPAILGKKAGLHPLLSMFCMYLGYSLFGIPGLLLFPPLACLGREIMGNKDGR